MGNKGSKLDTDKICDMTNEACATFSKEFVLAFKDAIMQKIKKDHSENELDKHENRLLPAPPGDQFIKTGYLIKLGGQVHNWKRRYFIAMNKADNYAFVYSENEQTSTVKGKFYCCGYTVVPFSKEELSTFGIYGMKLTPPDPTKRQWYIRAKTLEEYKQWFEVFSSACRKTVPPGGEMDEVKTQAFRVAYRNMRASYGVFGVPNLFGTENDLLEIFMFRLLKRELLDCFLEEVAAKGAQGKKDPKEIDPEELAVTTTITTIRPIILATWRESSQTVDVMKSSFEASVIPIFETYLSTEQSLLGLIYDRISIIAVPVLKDARETIIKPLLAKSLSPLILAYEQALQGLTLTLRSTLDAIAERPESLLKEVSPNDGLLEQIDAGPLALSQTTLRQLTVEEMTIFASIFEKSNLQGFDIYLILIDNIRMLSRNALYTYTSLVSAALATSVDSPGPGLGERSASMKPIAGRPSAGRMSEDGGSPLARHPSMTMQRSPSMINPLSKKRASALPPSVLRPRLNDVLNDTIEYFGDDAKRSIRNSLRALLTDLLEYPVQERIYLPCAELAFQHGSKIPKNLVNVISFPAIIDRYIRKLVADDVNEVLNDTISEISERIDAMVSRMQTPTAA